MMFDITDSYKATVALVNSVVEDKAKRDSFVPILQRIADRLHAKGESAFSTSEEAQLQEMLGLSEEDVNRVLALCSYTFQQAAYQGAAPQVVSEHMTAAGANATQEKCFTHIWSQAGGAVVKALRDQKFGAVGRLEHVSWWVQLADLNSSSKEATQQSSDTVDEPSISAVLQLDVSPADNNKNKSNENIAMSFTHDELYDFFDKLEIIQEQLDALNV
mmetsp:Transcript_20437/g.24535  ORF Transcript_20437/g.24535 Transcript_20437/m.24535 type:complete len:217 (+) Transcript_20437:214-864(+)